MTNNNTLGRRHWSVRISICAVPVLAASLLVANETVAAHLEQADLPEQVELQAEPGRLVVTAARSPRAGWAEAARRMHAVGDDVLIDPPQSGTFDDEEWEW